MFLLDTDTFSLFFRQRDQPTLLVQRITSLPPEQIFVSIVTVEEIIGGAFAVIRRERPLRRGADGYRLLQHLLVDIGRFQILSFDNDCLARFLALPPVVRRIGSADCMIGVCAVLHGLTIVTRNLRDFSLIPGVVTDDWTVPIVE
ncbi:MAG TPA: type II toxin-antitoxin system VapC family toxin [Armatimonadota bacterium]|nr:type II toxin-antitoxin system VapC family toxin [Armatimonadota bacterium]